MKVSIPPAPTPQRIQGAAATGPESRNQGSDFSTAVEESRSAPSNETGTSSSDKGLTKSSRTQDGSMVSVQPKHRSDSKTGEQPLRSTDPTASDLETVNSVEGLIEPLSDPESGMQLTAELLDELSVEIGQALPLGIVPIEPDNVRPGKATPDSQAAIPLNSAGLVTDISAPGLDADAVVQTTYSGGNPILSATARQSGMVMSDLSLNNGSTPAGLSQSLNSGTGIASLMSSSPLFGANQSSPRVNLGTMMSGPQGAPSSPAPNSEPVRGGIDTNIRNAAQNKMQELINRLSPIQFDEMVQLRPQQGRGVSQLGNGQIPVFAGIAPHEVAEVIGRNLGGVDGTEGSRFLSSISSQVASAISNKSIELQLVPRSLGVVHVKIANTQGQISIVMQTTTVEAEQLLRAELVPLQEAIRAAGHSIDDARISIQHNSTDKEGFGQGLLEDAEFAANDGDDTSGDTSSSEELDGVENDYSGMNSEESDTLDYGQDRYVGDGLYF